MIDIFLRNSRSLHNNPCRYVTELTPKDGVALHTNVGDGNGLSELCQTNKRQ